MQPFLQGVPINMGIEIRLERPILFMIFNAWQIKQQQKKRGCSSDELFAQWSTFLVS